MQPQESPDFGVLRPPYGRRRVNVTEALGLVLHFRENNLGDCLRYWSRESKRHGQCRLRLSVCKGFLTLEGDQGRSYGGRGRVPPPLPHIIGAPAPCPHKKNHAYVFFILPISRVCKYFAPHKKSCLCILKVCFKIFICKWLFLPIHIERNSTCII